MGSSKEIRAGVHRSGFDRPKDVKDYNLLRWGL